MTMQCPECQVEVEPAAVYCHKCGTRLDEAIASDKTNAPKAKPEDQPAGSKTTPSDKLRGALQGGRDVHLDPEEEIWTGGYSGKAMLGTWILTTVVALAACVIGGIVAGINGVLIGAGIAVVAWMVAGLILAYRKMNVHYQLTSQRFIHKLGVFHRVTDRIEVIDMDDVTYSQGLVQRLLGVGTIKIVSSDRSHPELWLYGIDEVQRVAGLIDDVRRLERRRRGIKIESL